MVLDYQLVASEEQWGLHRTKPCCWTLQVSPAILCNVPLSASCQCADGIGAWLCGPWSRLQATSSLSPRKNQVLVTC